MIPENNIKESVLHKIVQKELMMQPKSFFVFRWICIVFLTLLALLLSILAISFAAHSIHESGELFLLGFGARGLCTFFILFPWILILFACASIILLEILLRSATSAYRVPVLYLFIGFVYICFLLGLGINSTPFHAAVSEYAEKNDQKMLHEWYERLSIPDEEHGEFRGTVISVQKDSFVVSHNDYDSDEDDGVHTIIPIKGSKYVAVAVGDEVYVAGDIKDGIIYAYGIGKLK